jgi:type IV pilus assembly protein PilA
MANKHQTGFTHIELMIAASFLVMLGATAVVSFQDYSQQARISKGMSLSAGVKAAVNEYYSRASKFPVSNMTAGISAPEEITDEYVKSIGIGTLPVDGTITITYTASGSISEGDTLLLIPEINAYSTEWACTSSTLIANLLPANCT